MVERNRNMIITKITHGRVAQIFKDGKCVNQVFICGDVVEYEDKCGQPIPNANVVCSVEGWDFPFNMVQPLSDEQTTQSAIRRWLGE